MKIAILKVGQIFDKDKKQTLFCDQCYLQVAANTGFLGAHKP
jgi:hypothetical protein